MADKAISVSFHGNNLYLVNHNGEPFTPMKPITEGMGMDWASQFTKLKQRFNSTIAEITMVAEDGRTRKMVCLPLRKLAGWLQTISPNKVKPEIRDKVIQYQNECDDVLYEYWTTGEVKRKAKTTVDERTPLRDAVNLLVSKKHLMYPEAYAIIHQRFNVQSIEELDGEQIPVAVEYVHKLVLEGEFIGKEVSDEEIDAYNAQALAKHYRVLYETWKTQIYPALRQLESPLAGRLHDRFKDGYAFLMYVEQSAHKRLKPGQKPRLN
ncbi:phage antirepressor N-terminal domain-containing protein [Serratia marcescens]|uniref:phage antirepressor N-terminal domain-containing protein n=1 Tax=Serratia marcescens TaxID=615 RepID=UPI0009B53E38|nr:phage antirepressor N-terminal domain-containing protein [Serratia marcescens]